MTIAEIKKTMTTLDSQLDKRLTEAEILTIVGQLRILMIQLYKAEQAFYSDNKIDRRLTKRIS